MDEPLTIDAVLEGGLDAILNPAAARRRAASQLPELVARGLRDRMDPTRRGQLASRLKDDVWPAVHVERGARWDLGWEELTAGMALAIELLDGELPRRLRAEIQGTAAETAWLHARRPYLRFVLLVDSAVHICRVLVAARPRSPRTPVESSSEWMVDGPPFRDRSHTLMLALMADGKLPGDAGPVAATGELLDDGERVGPSGALVEKATAWRKQYPEGLLISPPPRDLDADSWAALAAESPGPPSHGDTGWLVGATLKEIAGKLAPDSTTLASWDGTPLTIGAMLEPRFAAVGAQPPDRAFRDSFLDAAWAAFRAARSGGRRRGVAIQGSPGAGKSTLSKVLERRFARGALSSFGFGVRRSARELASDLEGLSSPTWSVGLAVRDRSRATLYEALETTDRLVPIVDGLDELEPRQLQVVVNWLRTGGGWWIVTTRPMPGFGAQLPEAWVLRLEDLRPEDTRKLLQALDRADLADALSSTTSRSATSPFHALTRTPLQTALLARVVRPGELLLDVPPHALYERLFAALLDHACLSGRLQTPDAALVKRLLATVIGELAIAWLRSPDALLDRGTVDAAFDGIDMAPQDQARAIEALEFGHLLVPVGSGWEFSHRTMAEWAAASALRRRVESDLRMLGSPLDRGSPSQRAEVELGVLAPFLDGDVIPHLGRWATLLRFYAPCVKEPIALLDRLVGPERVLTWRMDASGRDAAGPGERRMSRAATSTECLESWAAAFDILRLCRWDRTEDARVAWAVAARRWLLAGFGTRGQGGSEWRAALTAFAHTVGEHLPETFDELVALAGRNAAQRERLACDPLVLLPALPATRAATLSGFLERGTRAQQVAVIEWSAERGVEPPRHLLDRIAAVVADELELPSLSGQEEDDARCVRSRLEVAVWKAYLAHGVEPPWAVIRRRFAAWPKHLGEQLTRWFGATVGSDPHEDCHRRRRELLASWLERATTLETSIAAGLDAIQDVSAQARTLARLRYLFDSDDDPAPMRTVADIASARGWIDEPASGREPRAIDSEPVVVALRETVLRLCAARDRIAGLVAALDDRAADGVVGELWALLPPEHAGRREILLALDRREYVPRKVPAGALVRHHAGSAWRLERIRWTTDHLEQLQQVSKAGSGRERFDATCALARATGRDEMTELLQRLPTGDEVFARLVHERVSDRTRTGDEIAAPLTVLDPSRMPLSVRAGQDVPGWRAELLAKLATSSGEDAAALAEVALRHEVREALPFLARCLSGQPWRDARIIEAIALLATDRDEGPARIALRHALRSGWPDDRATWTSSRPLDGESGPSGAGVALARFLRIDDLDHLAEGEVSALRQPSLAAAIRALGPAAIDPLLALHDALVSRVAELDEISRSGSQAATRMHVQRDLEDARKRLGSLAETVIAALEPLAHRPAEVVDLLFRIVGEDVHRVYGLPGPLGSDYDDPGDMDWHSSHETEDLVRACTRLMEESVRRRPDERGVLRRLFEHPSELLRKRAFELCADRADAHEVAELAIEALEGHVRKNRTRWTGDTAGLLLAGHQSGAGSVYLDVPDTRRQLVAAVRARLTPAHADVVRKLTMHPLAALRRLGTRWAGELGTESWSAMVLPLFDDVDPGVVWAALGALAALAPSRLDAAVAGLGGTGWTAEHDRALLDRLGTPDDPFRLLRADRDGPPNVASHVTQATLATVLTGAAARAASCDVEQRRAVSCFADFPCLVEAVLANWPAPLGSEIVDVFRSWIDDPTQEVREVGRRLLAMRGLLEVSVLERLLTSAAPAERFSGAECVVAMAVERLAPTALAILRGALLDSPDEDDLRAVAIEPPTNLHLALRTLRAEALGNPGVLRSRLLLALRGATPAFAQAVALVAHRLPFDHTEGCLLPEAEETVREVQDLIRRWGAEGAVSVLTLLDSGTVDDDCDSFLGEIRRIAEHSAVVRTAVSAGAARGGTASASVLNELANGEFDRDLDALAMRLAEDVFPPGWPDRANALATAP